MLTTHLNHEFYCIRRGPIVKSACRDKDLPAPDGLSTTRNEVCCESCWGTAKATSRTCNLSKHFLQTNKQQRQTPQHSSHYT